MNKSLAQHIMSESELASSSMSNFDHEIPEGLEEELKSGKKVADYPAWNFHGSVFFYEGRFYCAVMRYHVLADVEEADNLKELMQKCSDKYGHD